MQTRSGYVFDIDDPLNQDKNEYLYSGGDGVVPSESLIIPGLKWSKTNKQIRFVDYCSNYIPNNENSVNGIGYDLKNEEAFIDD